jgi:hypothetical protein
LIEISGVGVGVVLHPKAVPHLVGRDVSGVGWRQGHLASAIGAAVYPERGSSEALRHRHVVHRPVLAKYCDLAEEAVESLVAAAQSCPDRRIYQPTAAGAYGVGVFPSAGLLARNVDLDPVKDAAAADVDGA